MLILPWQQDRKHSHKNIISINTARNHFLSFRPDRYRVITSNHSVMKTLSFKCPECAGKFGGRIDYIPDGARLIHICPICHRKVELTPDQVVDDSPSAVVAVNFSSNFSDLV